MLGRSDGLKASRGAWLRVTLMAAFACCIVIALGTTEVPAKQGSGDSGGEGSHYREGGSRQSGGFGKRRCAYGGCERAKRGGYRSRKHAQHPQRRRQHAERHRQKGSTRRHARSAPVFVAPPRPAAAVPAPAPAQPSRFVIPASREARYVRNEVLIEIPSSLTSETLQRLERRLGLTRIASRNLALLGSQVNRYRIRPSALPGIVRTLRAEALVAGAQPNYVFSLQQAPQPAAPSVAAYSLQYMVAALHLAEAHRLATGKGIRIAIIDSGVDGDSFGIKDRIVARLDTLGGPFEADLHGTAVAGAIVAHGKLTGVAPDAQVIAIRAFTGKGGQNGAEATSDHILQGLEFAAAQNANIVNMSFAGPHDALLARALEALRAKGIAEIAAAGNGGAQSDPLYPGAEPGVIAVTATDQNGRLFGLANRGGYIALAAPGVDILLPAPAGSVQIASGTSIAAAHVTGIAALALERYGILTPDALIKALDAGAHMPDATARPEEYGAGVVDAYGVVQAQSGVGPAASATSP
jgi:subtilisin family serine protease